MFDNQYESSREVFQKITRQYKEYLKLYRFFNGGKADGATPFEVFYWNQVYYSFHDNEFTFERGY